MIPDPANRTSLRLRRSDSDETPGALTLRSGGVPQVTMHGTFDAATPAERPAAGLQAGDRHYRAFIGPPEKDAEWAARKLSAYLEKEKAFKLEEFRLRSQSRQHNLEDQRDELEQLEQMYREDELVDATEEIVLKRQRHVVECARFQLERARVLRDEELKVSLPRREAALRESLRRAQLEREWTTNVLPLMLAT